VSVVTIKEHFKCQCGHQWQREMDLEEGLVQVGCPICERGNMTMFGRAVLPLIKSGFLRAEEGGLRRADERGSSLNTLIL
jgi:hypothetical protein